MKGKFFLEIFKNLDLHRGCSPLRTFRELFRNNKMSGNSQMRTKLPPDSAMKTYCYHPLLLLFGLFKLSLSKGCKELYVHPHEPRSRSVLKIEMVLCFWLFIKNALMENPLIYFH